jgi:transketolase
VAPWFIDDTPSASSLRLERDRPVDGHDVDAVDAAIAQAKKSATSPR